MTSMSPVSLVVSSQANASVEATSAFALGPHNVYRKHRAREPSSNKKEKRSDRYEDDENEGIGEAARKRRLELSLVVCAKCKVSI